LPRLLIAGCGVAAGFMALRALQLGFSPVLLKIARSDVGGIEIIPASARHLLGELGLETVLARATPGLADGLLLHHDGATQLRPGRALHVDRLDLRALVIEEACARGAEIREVERLPVPDRDCLAIDATGQRAAWSRPVVRYGRKWADLFSTPNRQSDRVGHLISLKQGWAYAASDQRQMTIGVICPAKRRISDLEQEVRQAFGIDSSAMLHYLGRRPAFPQAARMPLRSRTIAIGDAAFTHDPIGGRGISFALGSVFAAGAVLQTWRDRPKDADAAASYYLDYVRAESSRHFDFLLGAHAPKVPTTLPSHVVWSAVKIRAAVAMPDGVVNADAALTRGGAAVRWLGKLDILTLRTICQKPEATRAVIDKLCIAGLKREEAGAVIGWALQHGVLGAGRPVKRPPVPRDSPPDDG
jgi:hypothetical protein